MPYLHPDDVLARAVAWAEREGDLDEAAPDDDWQERVLAEQLALAEQVPGVYEQLSPSALQAYPVIEISHAAEDTAEDPANDTVGLSLQDAGERILAQVEALEADRSRLDGRIVEAYGALYTVIGEQLARDPEVVAATGLSVDEVVLAELTTATAVPPGEAARRLRLGIDRHGCAGLRCRLSAGTVSLLHATMIAEECAALAVAEGLSDDLLSEVIVQVTERVLAPLPDGSRPGHALIRSRLTRVIKSMSDPAAAGARRARARARRGLTAELTEDGMGLLALRTNAEQVVAIMDRIEHLARAMRQAGDPRSLDQLRADLAAEALLRHGYGPCPAHNHEDKPGDTTHPETDSASDVDGADVDEADVDDAAVAAGPGVGACGCAPSAPPASVWIVVPFEVATGASDAACELPGHGWVTAEHARAIITAPGSVWRWLGVDAATGHALELGTDRYRPTPGMIEQVRAIDGHCRGPGCQVPARRCDLDHHVPHPHGPTTVANLGPLHRRHHNLKTAGLWTAWRTPPPPDTGATLAARTDRGLAWRTLTGREYVTYPKSWTEALHDPEAPEHSPPTRRPAETADERRAREAAHWREHFGFNNPPPF